MNVELQRSWTVAEWWQSLLRHPYGASVQRGPDLRVVLVVAVAAAVADAAVRAGVSSVTGSVLVAVMVLGLFASGRLTNPHGMALVGAALLFAPWLSLRTSPWLVPLDVAAAGGLLVAGCSLATAGSVVDLTIPRAAIRAADAAGHALAAPAFVVRALWPQAGAAPADGEQPVPRAAAVARGVAIALPVVVVLGVLLASADAVFASFFRGWSPAGLIEHSVLLVAGGWGMAALLRIASASGQPELVRFPRRLGTTETTVVLGSLVALFSAFAVAQLVALSGGAEHVLRTAGLTYAEYARAGFFQLLAVAVITLAVLLSVRAVSGGDEAANVRFAVLAEAAVALTLLIVVVAVRRLDLYEDEFGLTMLRLYSEVFAYWIAVVFVLLGLQVAGVGRRRSWFLFASAVAGLLALVALNAVNPEATVVRHNVERADRSGRFDPAYLADLSDDAVPALVDALPELDPQTRDVILDRVCAGHRRGASWAAFNAARDAAVEARSRACAARL